MWTIRITPAIVKKRTGPLLALIVRNLPGCSKPFLPVPAHLRTLTLSIELHLTLLLPKIIICSKIPQFLARALNPCKIHPRNKLQDLCLDITWQRHQARWQAQIVQLTQRYHQRQAHLILQDPPQLMNFPLLCCAHLITIQVQQRRKLRQLQAQPSHPRCCPRHMPIHHHKIPHQGVVQHCHHPLLNHR
ncbi:Os03g0232050 [Oryza sativa Japonica Group]|uniref:Os03g0232050 protein n=1 Tax=Oryza sativa subsp. japonica TaxID=39947 RepID=A0A0P0VV37_ORYSJ|nr:hypothetical protein EE612_016304 [Oryza sativa]BAS83114.1 Os03g0232050 [Oryza sativa Japonica Group]